MTLTGQNLKVLGLMVGSIMQLSRKEIKNSTDMKWEPIAEGALDLDVLASKAFSMEKGEFFKPVRLENYKNEKF